MRHSGDTDVATPLKDTPVAGCPVTQDQQDACGVVQVTPGYDSALVGNYEERENIRNGDLYCKLLTEGNGKNKRTVIREDARGLNDDDNNNNKEVEEGAKYDDNKKSS